MNGNRRVRVQWTETALDCLRGLPKKVARGLMAKADDLEECDDPAQAHKPLVGPLKGHCRITYGRYRAVYRVDEEELANGDIFATITVTFVAAGIRRERSKDDVYSFAKKIIELGIIDLPSDD